MRKWLLLLLLNGCVQNAGSIVDDLGAETGPLDISGTTIELDRDQAVANGFDQIVATVAIKDANGQGVAGVSAMASVSGTTAPSGVRIVGAVLAGKYPFSRVASSVV